MQTAPNEKKSSFDLDQTRGQKDKLKTQNIYLQ